MDVGLPTTVDVDAALAEVRHRVRVQYRVYLVVVAVVSLVVGGLIVAFTTREGASNTSAALTPPPYWGQVCVPADLAADTVPIPTVTPQPLHVYVTGAVMYPGVVLLPADSLLADAVEAVGGATVDADLENVNLAAPLVDNQHVIVPRRAATPQPAAAAAPTAVFVAAPVNINTATAAELEMLPHIGPTMAQRIIAYRAANGPFQHIEDLQEVEGIGETRYKDIAPLITVE